MRTWYSELSSAEKVEVLENECRRQSQLIEHGRIDDACILWPRPIPVGERLPEVNADGYANVLAYHTSDGQWRDAGYSNGKFWDSDTAGGYCDDCEDITHWLPLPPKP
jgi:hypothetical protein